MFQARQESQTEGLQTCDVEEGSGTAAESRGNLEIGKRDKEKYIAIAAEHE
jgi:hypothetical protein